MTPVRDDALAEAPRTAPAGIAGAPSVLPDPASPAPDVWGVCDRVVLDLSVPDPAADPDLTTIALGGIPGLGRPVAGDEAPRCAATTGSGWSPTAAVPASTRRSVRWCAGWA